MLIRKGFKDITFIELVLTLLIMSIIVSVIWTVYFSYVRKQKREEMIGMMNSISLAEEKYHFMASRYGSLMEIGVSVAPQKNYVLVVNDNGPSTYTVKALAMHDQLNDTAGNSSCSLLELKMTNRMMTKMPIECWS